MHQNPPTKPTFFTTQQTILQLKQQISKCKSQQKTYKLKLQSLISIRQKITLQIEILTKNYIKQIKNLQQKIKLLETENGKLKKQNNLYQMEIKMFQERILEKEKMLGKILMKQGYEGNRYAKGNQLRQENFERNSKASQEKEEKNNIVYSSQKDVFDNNNQSPSISIKVQKQPQIPSRIYKIKEQQLPIQKQNAQKPSTNFYFAKQNSNIQSSPQTNYGFSNMPRNTFSLEVDQLTEIKPIQAVKKQVQDEFISQNNNQQRWQDISIQELKQESHQTLQHITQQHPQQNLSGFHMINTNKSRHPLPPPSKKAPLKKSKKSSKVPTKSKNPKIPIYPINFQENSLNNNNQTQQINYQTAQEAYVPEPFQTNQQEIIRKESQGHQNLQNNLLLQQQIKIQSITKNENYFQNDTNQNNQLSNNNNNSNQPFEPQFNVNFSNQKQPINIQEERSQQMQANMSQNLSRNYNQSIPKPPINKKKPKSRMNGYEKRYPSQHNQFSSFNFNNQRQQNKQFINFTETVTNSNERSIQQQRKQQENQSHVHFHTEQKHSFDKIIQQTVEEQTIQNTSMTQSAKGGAKSSKRGKRAAKSSKIQLINFGQEQNQFRQQKNDTENDFIVTHKNNKVQVYKNSIKVTKNQNFTAQNIQITKSEQKYVAQQSQNYAKASISTKNNQIQNHFKSGEFFFQQLAGNSASQLTGDQKNEFESNQRHYQDHHDSRFNFPSHQPQENMHQCFVDQSSIQHLEDTSMISNSMFPEDGINQNNDTHFHNQNSLQGHSNNQYMLGSLSVAHSPNYKKSNILESSYRNQEQNNEAAQQIFNRLSESQNQQQNPNKPQNPPIKKFAPPTMPKKKGKRQNISVMNPGSFV